MENKVEDTSMTTREFTLEFLRKITDNFSEEHIIGRGGYGVVYKGVLENGEEIALKKLHHMPGLDDTQFRNEFNHLMRAQHPNITRLVGYCYNIGHQRIKYGDEYIFAHVEERVLCFEYLQGGSLDKYISDESCGLDWHTRFSIIKGVCKGLNYLHNGAKDPIYHLDLKPANILLDKCMVPKIGDFGLSRLFPSAQTYITTKIIGTRGYMPPEYIERCEITSKFDVFSLGVIIVRIIAGDEGYSKSAHLSSQEFFEHVHGNWGKRLQVTMPSHTSEQIKTCIKIALRCVEVGRENRPTIAEIVSELNKVDIAESSLTFQVAKNQDSNSQRRGGIFIAATYRPPVAFDIFSCPLSPSSTKDELQLTDGVSYNYNGRPIPPAALETLLKIPKLADEAGVTDADIGDGQVSGLIFVSERDDGLETLYIGLRFNASNVVKVFSLADIFGTANFSGVRLEDSGCIGGGYSVGSRTVDHCLIYVSTKELAQECCSPCTVVYKTNLTTGNTERLTPQGVFDLSPAVSPSGKTVAVASFESKSWNGEIENLKTDIYVMNVDSEGGQCLERQLLIKNGGWPSWGSNNIIFFHRGTNKTLSQGRVETSWGVFRYNISTKETIQVTPKELDVVTPAAISETKVAVATIRKQAMYTYNYRDIHVVQYRHIEIFDTNTLGLPPVEITLKMRPKGDHYNPFVLDTEGRIGYHRCRSNLMQHGDHIPLNLHKLESPVKDVGLYQVFDSFPTISKDGSKLGFVNDKLKDVWVADGQGLRMVYEEKGPFNVFSLVWNQNPDKDIMYICIGPSFRGLDYWPALEIYSIHNVCGPLQRLTVQRLTRGWFHNAFPSTSPDGNKLVFTSTRPSETYIARSIRPSETYIARSKSASCLEIGNSRLMRKKQRTNLFIMLNPDIGESEEGWVTRLTNGSCIDTHCQWSPNSDWIVFSSTRGKPSGVAAELDNVLLPLHFSVYLVKAGDPTVVIRVMNSLGHFGAVFSPDGRSIAVTRGLKGVSVDPISLPRFMHPVIGYNNIFVVDIDPNDLNKKKNKDVIQGIRRMTHSRYGWLTLAWKSGHGTDTYTWWNDVQAEMQERYNESEKWKMTGQVATSSSHDGLSD